MNSQDKVLNLNEKELIKLAQKDTDENRLEILSSSIYLNVRRCVAKNSNSSIVTINKLATDPSLNVSYWANKSKSCTKKREIDTKHPCILCEVDELKYSLQCSSCEKLKTYRF